ncbi:MAG: protein-disulfide reductase DsbD [Gammaproteobacteria bacterium]|nr:protein-disulfide reductase DsbD [Gammaproteobacteria bacterium]NNK98589.1 protein-disulfide reductase DsbD [Xanthomonadales bacterium]
MMKNRTIKWLSGLLLPALLLLGTSPATAIEFDEIKEYGEAFEISARAEDRQRIEISWKILDGFYLYNNKFLRFGTETAGVELGEAEIPPGKREFDDLLGEQVIKFHDEVTIRLPLESIPPGVDLVSLKVRSQGCMEDVFCYPPTEQLLVVNLPAAAANEDAGEPSSPAASIADVFNQPQAGAGQDVFGQEPALPPEEAFVYEAIGESAATILVRLTAQPGYYLYRDKLAFRVLGDDGFVINSVELPAGTTKDDPEFGLVEVYYGQVEIPVHVNRPAGPEQTISLEADYQGCRDGDICYPPQSMAVALLMPPAAVAIEAESPTAKEKQTDTSIASLSADSGQVSVPASEQDVLARMLLDNPAGAMLAFFIAGLLLAFTPCVFPMVPILSGIIAGQGENMTATRAFWLSLVYVLAMAVTYTVAGVLAGLFGQNLQALFQNPWILGFFIAIFIALALSMFGFFELQLPASLQTRLTQASNQQKGGSLTGVAVMGFLSALIVGPCVAPPLTAALIVIGASGSAYLGGAALFALSMGMGVPLILFGVSAGKLVPRAGPWMDAIKAVFGIGLLALAIWMLERIVQGPVILLLWGVLAISSGVYLGALERIPDGASGWRRLWKSLGLVLLLVGALEIVGALSGGDDWMKPLKGVRGGGHSEAAEHVAFERIKSLGDLEVAVAAANQSGQPAMLDFYADWCVECVRMERNTFVDPAVQTLFEKIQPLKADVTDNDDTDQALMRQYGVIGPPAILFFNRNGEELPAFRLVGYFEPEEFAAHLGRVLEVQ